MYNLTISNHVPTDLKLVLVSPNVVTSKPRNASSLPFPTSDHTLLHIPLVTTIDKVKLLTSHWHTHYVLLAQHHRTVHRGHSAL